MTEKVDKTLFLNQISESYAAFEALLSSLTEVQMTTKGVNSDWSVKDNIAHLSFWQGREIGRVQAVSEGIEFTNDPLPANLTEEEINERIYQDNKDRPLADVLAEFRTTYQALFVTTQALTEEQLNRPIPWMEGRSIIETITGNTDEHYKEHGKIIQDWLAYNA